MSPRIITDAVSMAVVKSFLDEHKLPSGDLILKGNNYIVGFYIDSRLVGTGALEFYSSYSLLRSIALAEDLRGKSLGHMIVEHLIDVARQQNVKAIFLLTETAPAFFDKLGFIRIDRVTVPSEVKASTEFAAVCPVSAICMKLVL